MDHRHDTTDAPTTAASATGSAAHEGHTAHADNGDGLSELLDLDAEVMGSYLITLIEWLEEMALAASMPVRRILDLGAGTGAGTLALARHFSDAEVIALDADEEMLARVRRRARALPDAIGRRIHTLHSNLDEAWPALELGDPVDLIWAASSVHELAEPDRIFADSLGALTPGGLMIVSEMDAPPMFLTDPAHAGLESRLQHAIAAAHPGWSPSWEWGPALERAGFAHVTKRAFPVTGRDSTSGKPTDERSEATSSTAITASARPDTSSGQPPAVSRYARAYFQRIRPALDGRATATDLAEVDALLDDSGPAALLHRTDLVAWGTRTAWLGRRP